MFARATTTRPESAVDRLSRYGGGSMIFDILGTAVAVSVHHDVRDDHDVPVYGLWIRSVGEIRLDRDCPPGQRRKTLMHELAHAYEDMLGRPDPSDTEGAAERFATIEESISTQFGRQGGESALHTMFELSRARCSGEWAASSGMAAIDTADLSAFPPGARTPVRIALYIAEIRQRLHRFAESMSGRAGQIADVEKSLGEIQLKAWTDLAWCEVGSLAAAPSPSAAEAKRTAGPAFPMLFAMAGGGKVAPAWPFGATGATIRPDGRSLITLKQAAELSGQPEASLRERFRTVFSDLLGGIEEAIAPKSGPNAGKGPQSPGGSSGVVGRATRRRTPARR